MASPCEACLPKYCSSPYNPDGECWQMLENKNVQAEWLQIALQKEKTKLEKKNEKPAEETILQ